MPIYVYKCSCAKILEIFKPLSSLDSPVQCECGQIMKRQVASSNPHIWKPGFWEHISEQPIYIESKKQLKEVCKKRGVIATGYM